MTRIFAALTLLLALFVTWVATAQAIYIAAFGYAGATGFSDFAQRVLTTPQLGGLCTRLR